MRKLSHLGMMAAAAASMMALPGIAIQSVGIGNEVVAPTRPARRQRVEIEHRAPPPRLNRARRWQYASTYENARALSPYPDRPVR